VATAGRPVEGVTVLAHVEGKRLDFRCTDALGAFAMEVPSGLPVTLSVRSKEGSELHRDPEAVTLKQGQQQFREIDLARAVEEPCPEPPPGGEEPGVDTFPMVDLVGQREPAARALLRTQGLELAEREEQPEAGPAGLVLSQSPDAGTPVRRGADVGIVVRVPLQVHVPSVVGLALEEARKILEKSELAMGQTSRVRVGRDKVGLVVRQQPDAGAQAERGTAVKLWVGVPRQRPGGPARPRGGREPEVIARIAARAEERVRSRGGAADAPPGYVAAGLENAGVHDRAEFDSFLARDRREIRERLGLRLLRDTERTIAALKWARSRTDE
jgi:hypothetical protein